MEKQTVAANGNGKDGNRVCGPSLTSHQPPQNMIKKKLIGSGLGFESEGGEDVENGREEEMRKKRESKGELTGTWMGAGRRDLGLVRSLKMGLLVLGVSFF